MSSPPRIPPNSSSSRLSQNSPSEEKHEGEDKIRQIADPIFNRSVIRMTPLSNWRVVQARFLPIASEERAPTTPIDEDDFQSDWVDLGALPKATHQIIKVQEEEITSFVYQGIRYKIHPTRGDGACALHAMLGIPDRKGCYRASQHVREDYILEFQHKCNDENVQAHFVPVLKDLIGELKKLKSEELTLGEKIMLDLHEKTEPSDLEEFYKDFANTEDISEYYFDACRQKDYYFSTAEIAIAAYLFNKRVSIFALAGGNLVCSQYGSDNGQKVAIYHADNHYSRCLPE